MRVPSTSRPPAPGRLLRLAGIWALLACLSVGMGALLDLVDFPAARLVGPLIVATGFGLRGAPIRMPVPLHRMAQGVAGCLIAHSVTMDVFRGLLDHWLAILLASGITLAIAGLVGVAVGFVSGLRSEETIWGFLPGMAGTMIAMSHERGVDARLVAFMQILRLMIVILLMSMVARVLGTGAMRVAGTPVGDAALYHPGVWLTLVVAALGPLAARYLPVLPAAATLVPLVISSALQASGRVDMMLPDWLLVGGFLVIGAHVGLQFTPSILRHAFGILIPTVAGILGLMALSALTGAALAALLGLDLLTGILATVPGGIDTIAIIAIASDADVAFVMTLQVLRLFAVVLIGPAMARLLSRIAFPQATPAHTRPE